MKKIINSINLYPHEMSFRYKNKNRFFSLYGVIISIFTYGLMISLSYYFTYDLIYKTNPKVKTIESEIDEEDTFNLNDIIDSLELYFKINFNTTNQNVNIQEIFKEKLFLYFEIYDKNEGDSRIYFSGNFSNEIMNISDSSEYNFSTDIYFKITNETVLEKFNSSNGQVFEKYKDINYTIKNSLYYLYFEIQKPENVTNFIVEQSKLKCFLVDNYINTEEYDDYKIKSLKKLDLSLIKFLHIKYDSIQINTDSNPFFSSNVKQKAAKIDFYYVTYDEINLSSEYINDILIKLEFRNKRIHSRTYKKILDVLSELGGILNPILIIGKIFVISLNEKKYKLSIMNDIFTEEDITCRMNRKCKIIDQTEFKSRKNDSLKKRSFTFKEKNIINRLEFPQKLRNIYNNTNKLNIIPNFDILSKKKLEEENISKRRLINNEDFSKNSSRKVNFTTENKEIQLKILKDESKLNNKDISNLNFIIDINESKNLKKIMKDEDKKKEIKSYLEMNKKKKKEFLQYSSKDILISLFCSKKKFNEELTKKENIYNQLIKKLNNYLDITHIMRFSENFEKLKFILFNKNQIYCFDNFTNNVKLNFDIKAEEEQKAFFKLTKYFKKYKRNFMEKKIDKSIIRIMKNEMKNLIFE